MGRVKRLNMQEMLSCAPSFSEDLSSWDVSRVTNMYGMFGRAFKSKGKVLSSWDISSVMYMIEMFKCS